MEKEAKIAVQAVLIEVFQKLEKSNPTLLLDTLLQGTGPALISHALGIEESTARKRADTLKFLLNAVQKELAVSVQPTYTPRKDADGEEEE